MFRNQQELVMHTRASFVLNHGALGDVITSLPAIIWARQHHVPLVKLQVCPPSYQMELIQHLLAPYGEFEFARLQDVPEKGVDRQTEQWGAVVVNSVEHNYLTRNKCDMVDFAYMTLLDRLPVDDSERSYPTAAVLGERTIKEKYIVFPVGGTSKNKEFLPHILEPILEWTIDNGYLPVIVGSSKSHTHLEEEGRLIPLQVVQHYDQISVYIKERCHDLRDKTDLLGLRDLCGHALAVVGMDGGTLHLAGTTQVPIVYCCTHILPRTRSIVRNGERNRNLVHVIPRDLPCHGCQTNWTLMFGHDFRNCGYGDYKCVTDLNPRDFINALMNFKL